jgi:uncharacterized protein YegL
MLLRGGLMTTRNVMPFYLVCDVSWSMRDEIPTLREGIRRIRDQIRHDPDPILRDGAMVGIITFADTAAVPMQLGRLADCPVPDIECPGPSLTNYGAAFRMLAEEWEQDYLRLRDSGLRTYRPCAYFLTDGEPHDLDWEDTFAETLTREALNESKGGPGHPILVPFGFRDATESTLKRLAYPKGQSRWYHAKSASFESALTGLLGIIKNSMVSTGKTLPGGQFGHILPRPDDPGISSGTAA